MQRLSIILSVLVSILFARRENRHQYNRVIKRWLGILSWPSASEMDPSSSRTRENILMKRARRYSSRDREKGTIFRLRREKKAGRATGEPRKKAHFDRCNGRIHVNGSGEHPLFSSSVLIVHQPFRSPTFSLSLFLLWTAGRMTFIDYNVALSLSFGHHLSFRCFLFEARREETRIPLETTVGDRWIARSFSLNISIQRLSRIFDSEKRWKGERDTVMVI